MASLQYPWPPPLQLLLLGLQLRLSKSVEVTYTRRANLQLVRAKALYIFFTRALIVDQVLNQWTAILPFNSPSHGKNILAFSYGQ